MESDLYSNTRAWLAKLSGDTGMDLGLVVDKLRGAGFGALGIAKMMEAAGFDPTLAASAGVAAAFLDQAEHTPAPLPPATTLPPIEDSEFTALKFHAGKVMAEVDGRTGGPLIGDVLDSDGKLVLPAVDQAEAKLRRRR